MTTFALADGMTLVISVVDGEWETVTCVARDLDDVGADEVAQGGGGPEALRHRADESRSERGSRPRVQYQRRRQLDRGRSGRVDGRGCLGAYGWSAPRRRGGRDAGSPRQCRHRAVPSGAGGGDATRRGWADVVTAINRTFDRVARPAGGAPSLRARLVVRTQPGATAAGAPPTPPSQPGTPGAAAPLTPMPVAPIPAAGTSGTSPAAAAGPTTAPAGAAPARPGLRVVNLTAAPIQFVMVTRTLVVPAGGSALLSPAEAAHRPLQRLAARGAVQLILTR